MFPWQLLNINSFLPGDGAKDVAIGPGLLPPVAKPFRCRLFSVLLGRASSVGPVCGRGSAGLPQPRRAEPPQPRSGRGSRAGSFGSPAPAPPRVFEQPLLRWHRSGTGFLPLPGRVLARYLRAVALGDAKPGGTRGPWCCMSGAYAPSSVRWCGGWVPLPREVPDFPHAVTAMIPPAQSCRSPAGCMKALRQLYFPAGSPGAFTSNR